MCDVQPAIWNVWFDLMIFDTRCSMLDFQCALWTMQRGICNCRGAMNNKLKISDILYTLSDHSWVMCYALCANIQYLMREVPYPMCEYPSFASAMCHVLCTMFKIKCFICYMRYAIRNLNCAIWPYDIRYAMSNVRFSMCVCAIWKMESAIFEERCPISLNVWYSIYDERSPLSDVLCATCEYPIFDAWCAICHERISNVRSAMCHVLWAMIDIGCVICNMRYPISDIRCPITNVRCPMSDVRCPMSDVSRCPMSDVRCPMSDVRCPMSDVRCPMSDVRCPMSDVLSARRVLGIRCSNRNESCAMTNFRGAMDDKRYALCDISYKLCDFLF